MCKNKNRCHWRYFYHGNGFVEMRTDSSRSVLSTRDDSTVFLTVRCNICNPASSLLKSTPKIINTQVLEISFGIFLQFLFYQNQGVIYNMDTGKTCHHWIQQDMAFIFEIGNVSITFWYKQSYKFNVDLYDLRSIDWNDLWKSLKIASKI